MIRILACLAVLPLAACGVQFGGAPFVSGTSPQSGLSANAAPEPAGSLPPGFGGVGGGPNAAQPNEAAITIPTPF